LASRLRRTKMVRWKAILRPLGTKTEITYHYRWIVATLYEVLRDIVKIDNVMFIVKSEAATAEVQNRTLQVRDGTKFVTVGGNDDPAHIHVNVEKVTRAEFVQEEKEPGRYSFSIRFFDDYGQRVIAAFFTKMYDEEKNIIPWKRRLYDDLKLKYTERIEFEKRPHP